MRDIFISYRRDDAQGHAGRLWDHLQKAFGPDRLFYDQRAVNPGELWSERIDRGLREAQIILALIGSGWLEAKDAQGRRRLENPEDVVRRELAVSLAAGKTVIPILIEDTRLPVADRLPPELAPLAGTLQYQTLRSQEDLYQTGVRRLLEQLREQLTTASGRPADLCPEKLPYLCDRSPQEERLREVLELQTQHAAKFRRPMLWIVHGAEGEAHGAFLDRLESRSLPQRLELLGFAPRLQFLRLKDRPRSQDPPGFAREFRRAMADELQLPGCEQDSALLAGFNARRATVLAPVLALSSREAQAGQTGCLDLLLDYWSAFPDLPPGLAAMCFLSLKFAGAPPAKPGGFLRPLLSMFRPARPDPAQLLRDRIAALRERADPAGVVVCHVLPELSPVTPEDVDRWALAPEVSRHIRHLSDQKRREIFAGRPALPMDDVIEKLSDLITPTAASPSHD